MPISHLLQQANIGQSRSSVLNPLQWLLVILVAGIAVCLSLHSPSWLITLFAVLLVLTFVLLFSFYIYFARTDPDALRSEQFSLSKLAIQKGLVGDSIMGLQPSHLTISTGTTEAIPVNPTPRLPSAE